jgi:hypothetical protein
MQFRKDISDKLQKLEYDRNAYLGKIDSLISQKKALETEVGALNQKLKMMERSNKENMYKKNIH